MIAIIGLGNHGSNYDKTVHNLGYMALDFFANKNNLKFLKKKYFGVIAEGVVNGEKVVLLKPQTYMNLSGKSVLDIVQKLKLPLSQIVVLVDDIDLPFADIRVRTKGSGGSHNGLKDIVCRIGSEFPRIRIGAKGERMEDLASYVLSKISKDKLSLLDDSFGKVSNILNHFLETKSLEGVDVNKF